MTAFPKDFVWGASTASYQIEGGVTEGGRGETVWDRFTHTPGRIKNGDTGDTACDHYRRYREDVAVMKRIGLKAYRFSIGWSRIFPKGGGQVNPAGVDFYSRLTDELLKNGIAPYVTLFHWDLPQALQDRGGFANRDTAYYFRDYAAETVRRLGDRIKYWMTLNEPGVYVSCGNLIGVHAPGIRDVKTAFSVSHHLLLGHGEAVRAMRGIHGDLRLGIAVSASFRDAATDRPEDAAAAARARALYEEWYLDPIFKGKYPSQITETCPEYLPETREGDMAVIHTPLDWLGINNYSRTLTAHDPDGFLQIRSVPPQDAPVTDFGWEVIPEAIYRVLKWISEDYDPPEIVITENGASYSDGPDGTGRVRDRRRIDFLRGYLGAVRRAVMEGVKLKGYFVWSLLDNFEWAEGYLQRFGIVHVDYKTQKRTLKDSAYWYRDLIASNGGNLQAQ